MIFKNLIKTVPPSIKIDDQYKNEKFPSGEVQNYINENAYRTSSEELKLKDKI
jgi:methionyl aminopeptidase